jgi:hypothetical protein
VGCGPTIDIWPMSSLVCCGSTSIFERRKMRPTAVTRSSFLPACSDRKIEPYRRGRLLSGADETVVPDVMAPTTIANGRIDQSPVCLFRIWQFRAASVDINRSRARLMEESGSIFGSASATSPTAFRKSGRIQLRSFSTRRSFRHSIRSPASGTIIKWYDFLLCAIATCEHDRIDLSARRINDGFAFWIQRVFARIYLSIRQLLSCLHSARYPSQFRKIVVAATSAFAVTFG